MLPPLSISDPVSAWEPRAEHVNAELSGGSTNDRRVQHSRRAGLGRATAPAFGASATPTGTSQRVSTQRAMGHHSYPPSSQATSSTQNAATIQNFRAGQQTTTVGGISKQTFLILLLPYIVSLVLFSYTLSLLIMYTRLTASCTLVITCQRCQRSDSFHGPSPSSLRPSLFST